MLIPIGHDEMEVHRLPWFSFVVMIICMVVMVAISGSRAEETLSEKANDVIDFYVQHPWLTFPEDFQKQFNIESPSEETTSEEFQGLLKERRPPEFVLQSQQEELDELARDAIKAYRKIPTVKWGVIPASPTILALFTYMFMHAGWLHLIGNLFMLYLTGPRLEDVWGRKLFGIFYVAAGVVSGFLFTLHSPDTTIPLVGASGAIAGAMGAFMVRLWHTRIRFFYWFGLVFRGTFDAPAWAILPLWFGGELFSAWAVGSSSVANEGGVAYWAHIWGFVFGAGCAGLLRVLDLEKKWAPPPDNDEDVQRNPALDRAEVEIKANRPQQAFSILFAANRASPTDLAVATALWNVASDVQRSPEAAAAFARVVREDCIKGELDAAWIGWSQLLELAPSFPPDLATGSRLAERLVKAQRRQDANTVINALAPLLNPQTPPPILERLAKVAAEAKSPQKLELLDRALAQPSLSPASRITLTALRNPATLAHMTLTIDNSADLGPADVSAVARRSVPE